MHRFSKEIKSCREVAGIDFSERKKARKTLVFPGFLRFGTILVAKVNYRYQTAKNR